MKLYALNQYNKSKVIKSAATNAQFIFLRKNQEKKGKKPVSHIFFS